MRTIPCLPFLKKKKKLMASVRVDVRTPTYVGVCVSGCASSHSASRVFGFAPATTAVGCVAHVIPRSERKSEMAVCC